MTIDEFYMNRCFRLALGGIGHTAPNPLVGCVIVRDGQVVSEGFHQQYGDFHAERNAIMRCVDPSLLEGSTLYVNLEPCSHYGHTPPCADLIVEHKVARVVSACNDPNPKVSGRGYAKLQQAGIDVIRGILQQEGRFLNRRFFTFMEQQRPYIVLKWAQSVDGLMDIDRHANPQGTYWITNPVVKQLSHRWRTEEAAILVGSTTLLNDHPQLTARLWYGNNPLRYVADRRHRIKPLPPGFTVLDQPTPHEMMHALYQQQVQSVIVEGGQTLLNAFLDAGLWDEIRLLQGSITLGAGTPAPRLSIAPDHVEQWGDNRVSYYYHH